jgi:hypothetical protein
MTKDPWTDSDPKPGDFDADLERIDPRYVEVHEGHHDARMTVLFSMEGEDAERLERIAAERGQPVDEVVADLLRDAERHTA